MGFRQWMDQQKGVATVIGVVLALGGITLFAMQLRNSPVRPPGANAWFTTDDGKTWFAAAATNLSPFQHNGKTAYRCYVCECPKGEEYVSYLERFTPEAHKKLTSGGPLDPMAAASVEVKRPGTGDTGWVRQTDPKSGEITNSRCPKHPDKVGEPIVP